MKTIRTLILLAIIVLIGLAFISRSPENPEQQDAIAAFMQPILEMQQKIEQNYPQLRGDLEKLKDNVRDKIATIDPKNLIPIHIPSSGSPLPADLQTPVEEKSASPDIAPELSQEVQNMAKNIDSMDANELAQQIKILYEKLQKQANSPTQENPPVVDPTPASQ